MKRLYSYILAGCMLLAACGDDGDGNTGKGPGETGGEGGGDTPSATLTGYAAPGGVLILSGGTYTQENAFLTFITPEGEAENNVYAQANGAELGNDGVGLYMCGGKQYILCNDWRTAEGKGNAGLLTVADAVTLKKEMSFKRADMVFKHPVNDVMEEVDESLGGIAVLDERNVFIFAQGVLRFDCTTGELTLVEGAYAIGNKGSANTVESTVSPRGAVTIGGCMYAATGGFWTNAALLEFAKGKDEVNRSLDLPRGDLVSGICVTDDGTLVVATYLRGKNSGYLYFIDIDSWKIKEEKTIAANISPGSSSNSGITYLNGYIYFTGADETEFTSAMHTTLSRYSVETGRVEKDIVDFKADEPMANLVDCGVVADRKSGYIYVATSDTRWEGVIPQSAILVYDCNGDTPKLVKKYSGVTHSVSGIYPMSVFATAD